MFSPVKLETYQSRRLCFIAIMTFSAPIFGGLQSYRKLRWQDDFLSDLLQVELVIAVGTLMAAYIFWSVLNRKRERKIRGGMAGLLTAICIVPLPVFGWAFKNQLIMRFNDSSGGLVSDIVSDIVLGFISALQIAAPVFGSKALAALPLSFAVGYMVARNSPKVQPV